MLRPTTGLFTTIQHKDEEASIYFREEGNFRYKEGKFFEALENYNKSLTVAPLKSRDVSLAYANRSAVYLTVKEYDLCIKNIQLAREHGYPKDMLQTLVNREEKCRKLMESCKPNPDDNPWNFFKLSYPANEKIPFIANCLELHQDKQYGRGIKTNRGNLIYNFALTITKNCLILDLKPGDIIAIEEPLFRTVSETSWHIRCYNCLKSNKMNLIPHDVCSTGSYEIFSGCCIFIFFVF